MVGFISMQLEPPSFNYNHAKEIHKHCLRKEHTMHQAVSSSKPLSLSRRQDNCQIARCFSKLEMLLESEINLHNTLGVLQTSNDLGMVTSSDRDCAVTSLRCLHSFYGFSPETFAAAINYLDRFICKVRVRTKYLSCVAASCYFISSKINEEPEDIPTASQLSHLHGCCWRSSDLKRMERTVLDKLKWNLSSVSCLSFVNVFYNILCIFQPDIGLSSVSIDLIKKFEVCASSTACAQHRPSTLALCLLQSVAKTSSYPTSLMNPYIAQIQEICQITEAEMSECLLSVGEKLQDYHCYPDKLPLCLPIPKPMLKPNLKSRPSLYGDTDLPTIYEDHSESILGGSSQFSVHLLQA
ncbi:hypothetical protein ScPMuIL_011311 [Solemya velum]